ncbi:MAG: hypothetical protein QOG70_2957 [Solirubrobacteraceae bacterium]|nr:hypothetical protein [Solirubrobacteraceae bacterium]
MSAVASGLRFELLRFAAAPVSAEVALVELEGRFRAASRRRLGVPRLVAERGGDVREIAPATSDDAVAEPDGALWRAVYAVALELVEDGAFSLGVGREVLVDLPAPDVTGASTDREVRLAREANALRRTADQARDAAAAALASSSAEQRAREEAEAAVSEARLARDDLVRRASGLEDELAQARRAHAAELVRRDEERETALAARDVENTRLADERVAEVEAEAAEARRALRNARAEAEAARRDLERERERAQIAEAAVPRGRVTAMAGEPVAGEPVHDRPTTRIETSGDEALAAAREEADRSLQSDGDRNGDDGDDNGAPPTTVMDGDPTEPRAGGETVRVLGARRRRPSGDGPPADAVPGSAEIGARHIEPGATSGHRVAGWLTRVLALAALAVVVIALLVVLKAF